MNNLISRYQWPFHILLWIGVWFFYVYFFSYNSSDQTFIFTFSSLLLPITIVTSYVSIYYLIPRFLLTKKYWKFSLYGVYTLIFSTFFILLAILGSFIFMSDLDMSKMAPMSRNYLFILILVFLVVALVSLFSLIRSNAQFITTNKELENQLLSYQLESKTQELTFLKKQIHPHFLFNTINTIYGHALKSSKETPDLLIKLSNLLDYILYQVQKPLVGINDEIGHIEEYISLEKTRQSDVLDVVFDKNIHNSSFEIPPMLMIPFVENCFKHGRAIDGLLKIRIDLHTSNNELLFKVENTCLATDLERAGIGLQNLRRRLELLYPDNYELSTSMTNQWYTAFLKINHNTDVKEI